jgi:ATP-dependent protease ClpP protease subunit
MKKILFVLSVVLATTFGLSANGFAQDENITIENNSSPPPCPKGWRNENNCLTCHTYPNMLLKESPPDEWRNYPHSNMWVYGDVVYFDLGSINDSSADNLRETLYYLDWHPSIKHLVINIYSGGGNLFQAWRIVGYLNRYKAKGYVVETRNYGVVASAAFTIFVAGTKGKRFVSQTSQTMEHELRMYDSLLDLFTGKTSSDSEEQTRVMKHLQESELRWLASRGKLSTKEIAERIKNKEFWMTGADAIKYGFADGYIK